MTTKIDNLFTYYILDVNKNPVQSELINWSVWFSVIENRRVAFTKKDDLEVSTVFLGIPHLGGMFETMVFRNGSSVDCERCETWAEAEKLHDQVCLKWLYNGGADVS